jgi:iron uptake system EfeUOB component EfeO/EfeM
MLAGCAGPINDSELLFLKQQGITLLVRLAEKQKAKVTSQQVLRASLKDLHEPIMDFHAPSQEQIDRIVKNVKEFLNEVKAVAILRRRHWKNRNCACMYFNFYWLYLQ